MKKRIPKKLELSRETLRSLGKTGLREVDGGRSDTCTYDVRVGRQHGLLRDLPLQRRPSCE